MATLHEKGKQLAFRLVGIWAGAILIHQSLKKIILASSKLLSKSCDYFILIKQHLYSLRYFLQIGDHNLLQKEESQLRIGAENIYIHPNFTRATYDNDIALIKLRTEVKLGKFVRTVCLPEKQEGDLAIPRKYGLVTGWGATKALKIGQVLTDTYRYSNILQYSSFMIQQDQICQRSTSHRFNSSVTFCAGDGKGRQDTCTGDSGGPFVREARREDGYRWIATGLVSWGEGCAQKDKFTFYTRVYPFINWIKKTMDEG